MQNKLIPHDKSKSLAYVQSVEKIENSLQIRKKLAAKLGLTSIGEFVEGRAVVNKDKKRMLLNEQGEFMKDDVNKDLGPVKGIIQTDKWIFSAKDGIIIVVDDRNYANGMRLYTTQGTRVPIPAGWDFDKYAIIGLDKDDEFSNLKHYYNESISHRYSSDPRGNIIDGRIPIEPRSEYFGFHEAEKIEAIYGMRRNCSYTLMNKKGEFFKTELGHYYVNNKQGFDFSHGLYPTIDPTFSEEFVDESNHETIQRPRYYMVDKAGKAFRDEYGEVVYSDDPFWINTFDKDGYAVVPIDISKIHQKIFLNDYDRDHKRNIEFRPYLCYIHKSGSYLKNSDGSIKKILFEKYIYSGNAVQPDVRGYSASEDKETIEVLVQRDEEHDDRDKRVYKKYNYKGEEIIEDKKGNTVKNIDFGPQGEHCHKEMGGGLIEHGYDTKKDYHHGSGEEFYYGGKRRIINTHFKNQMVKFPDGSLCSLGDFGDSIVKYKNGYIFHHPDVADKKFVCSFVKINGLIARYQKDVQGREIRGANDIEPLEDKFLAIQWGENDPYFIVDKNFAYIKDAQGNELKSKYRPFYTDGMLLMYDTNENEKQIQRVRGDMDLKKAYFEDGTLVGEATLKLNNTSDIIRGTRKKMTELL